MADSEPNPNDKSHVVEKKETENVEPNAESGLVSFEYHNVYLMYLLGF